MNKIYINLNVKGMQLTKKRVSYLAEGSANFIGLEISFSEEWEGLTKFAVCCRDAKEYCYALDEAGKCVITDGSVVGSNGLFQIKVVGADTANKVTATTGIVTIAVNSNDFLGCESTELTYPTDDFLAQTLANIKKLVEKIEKNNGVGYGLPIASSSVLGGIKVGDGLSVTPEGVLSADRQTEDISEKQDKLSEEQLTNLNADHSKYLTEHQDISGKLDADRIVIITQADYDSLVSKDDGKFYFIVEQVV